MAAISGNNIIACFLPGGEFEVVREAEGLVDVSKEVQSSVHLILDLKKKNYFILKMIVSLFALKTNLSTIETKIMFIHKTV